MDKYVITIQMPDILDQIFEEVDEEEKKDLEEILDLLEEFEDRSEYADIYLNGELMICFQAPSEKSAKGLFKLVKKTFKKLVKKYSIEIELYRISEDNRMVSLQG